MKNLFNKITKNIILPLAFAGGIYFNSFGQTSDTTKTYSEHKLKKVSCISKEDVEFVASEIPKHFKNKGDKTYLIENVPESKNGYTLGGELSVYITKSSTLSIFDRTDANPSNWYNVSNWEHENQGCVHFSVYLTGKPVEPVLDAQTKFNTFIYKVKAMMQTQK